MRFQAVLFDLDGTLVDSFQDIVLGLQIACEQMGFAKSTLFGHYVALGTPLEEFFSEFANEPPKGETFDRFVASYRKAYGLELTTAYSGARELLADLRQVGIKLAVASAKRTDMAKKVLAHVDLLSLFHNVSGSENLAPKPAPDVLFKALDDLGVSPAHALMVGDTARDVDAAKAAGCAAVVVPWGHYAKSNRLCDVPVFDFASLFAYCTNQGKSARNDTR